MTFEAIHGEGGAFTEATVVRWPDGFVVVEPGDLWRDVENREGIARFLRERHEKS